MAFVISDRDRWFWYVVAVLLAGTEFPGGDEQRLRLLARWCDAFGADMREVLVRFGELGRPVVDSVGSEPGAGFRRHGRAMDAHGTDIAAACRGLGPQIDQYALDLEATKYSILMEAATVTASVLWALSTPMTAGLIPAFLAGGRVTVARILALFNRQVLGMLTVAATWQAAQEAGKTLLVRLIQNWEGNSSDIDWGAIGIAAGIGAGAGAVAGGLSLGLAHHWFDSLGSVGRGALLEALTDLVVSVALVPLWGGAGTLWMAVLGGSFTGGVGRAADSWARRSGHQADLTASPFPLPPSVGGPLSEGPFAGSPTAYNDLPPANQEVESPAAPKSAAPIPAATPTGAALPVPVSAPLATPSVATASAPAATAHGASIITTATALASDSVDTAGSTGTGSGTVSADTAARSTGAQYAGAHSQSQADSSIQVEQAGPVLDQGVPSAEQSRVAVDGPALEVSAPAAAEVVAQGHGDPVQTAVDPRAVDVTDKSTVDSSGAARVDAPAADGIGAASGFESPERILAAPGFAALGPTAQAAEVRAVRIVQGKQHDAPALLGRAERIIGERYPLALVVDTESPAHTALEDAVHLVAYALHKDNPAAKRAWASADATEPVLDTRAAVELVGELAAHLPLARARARARGGMLNARTDTDTPYAARTGTDVDPPAAASGSARLGPPPEAATTSARAGAAAAERAWDDTTDEESGAESDHEVGPTSVDQAQVSVVTSAGDWDWTTDEEVGAESDHEVGPKSVDRVRVPVVMTSADRQGRVPGPATDALRSRLAAALRSVKPLAWKESRRVLGPDLFGLREFAPSPDSPYHRCAALRTEQVVAHLELLDLGRADPPTAAEFAAVVDNPSSVLSADRTGRPWPSVYGLGPASGLRMPKVLHLVWLGGSAAERGTLTRLTAVADAGRESGFTPVLWTDFDRQEVGAGDSSRGAALVAARMRAHGVVLLNLAEVSMRTWELVATELMRGTDRGVATAEHLVSMELMHAFGGAYIDAKRLERTSAALRDAFTEIEGTLTGVEGLGFRHHGGADGFDGSAFFMPRAHPIAGLYLLTAETKYLESARRSCADSPEIPLPAATFTALLSHLGWDAFGGSCWLPGPISPAEPRDRSAHRVRSGDDQATTGLAMRVAQTLISNLYAPCGKAEKTPVLVDSQRFAVAVGKLDLIGVRELVEIHEDPDLVWSAVLGLLRETAALRASISAIVLGRYDGAAGRWKDMTIPAGGHWLVSDSNRPPSLVDSELVIPVRPLGMWAPEPDSVMVEQYTVAWESTAADPLSDPSVEKAIQTMAAHLAGMVALAAAQGGRPPRARITGFQVAPSSSPENGANRARATADRLRHGIKAALRRARVHSADTAADSVSFHTDGVNEMELWPVPYRRPNAPEGLTKLQRDWYLSRSESRYPHDRTTVDMVAQYDGQVTETGDIDAQFASDSVWRPRLATRPQHAGVKGLNAYETAAEVPHLVADQRAVIPAHALPALLDIPRWAVTLPPQSLPHRRVVLYTPLSGGVAEDVGIAARLMVADAMRAVNHPTPLRIAVQSVLQEPDDRESRTVLASDADAEFEDYYQAVVSPLTTLGQAVEDVVGGLALPTARPDPGVAGSPGTRGSYVFSVLGDPAVGEWLAVVDRLATAHGPVALDGVDRLIGAVLAESSRPVAVRQVAVDRIAYWRPLDAGGVRHYLARLAHDLLVGGASALHAADTLAHLRDIGVDPSWPARAARISLVGLTADARRRVLADQLLPILLASPAAPAILTRTALVPEALPPLRPGLDEASTFLEEVPNPLVWLDFAGRVLGAAATSSRTLAAELETVRQRFVELAMAPAPDHVLVDGLLLDVATVFLDIVAGRGEGNPATVMGGVRELLLELGWIAYGDDPLPSVDEVLSHAALLASDDSQWTSAVRQARAAVGRHDAETAWRWAGAVVAKTGSRPREEPARTKHDDVVAVVAHWRLLLGSEPEAADRVRDIASALVDRLPGPAPATPRAVDRLDPRVPLVVPAGAVSAGVAAYRADAIGRYAAGVVLEIALRLRSGRPAPWLRLAGTADEVGAVRAPLVGALAIRLVDIGDATPETTAAALVVDSVAPVGDSAGTVTVSLAEFAPAARSEPSDGPVAAPAAALMVDPVAPVGDSARTVTLGLAEFAAAAGSDHVARTAAVDFPNPISLPDPVAEVVRAMPITAYTQWSDLEGFAYAADLFGLRTLPEPALGLRGVVSDELSDAELVRLLLATNMLPSAFSLPTGLSRALPGSGTAPHPTRILPIAHVVRLGGPLTAAERDLVVSGAPERGRIVVWTDIPRSRLAHAVMPPARRDRNEPSTDAELRAMAEWAWTHGVAVVNIWELFHRNDAMTLGDLALHYLPTRLDRAVEIVGWEILRRYGGLVLLGPGAVPSVESAVEALDNAVPTPDQRSAVPTPDQRLGRAEFDGRTIALLAPRGLPWVNDTIIEIGKAHGIDNWPREESDPEAWAGEDALNEVLSESDLEVTDLPTITGITPTELDMELVIGLITEWVGDPAVPVRAADLAATVALARVVAQQFADALVATNGVVPAEAPTRLADRHEDPSLIWSSVARHLSDQPELRALVRTQRTHRFDTAVRGWAREQIDGELARGLVVTGPLTVQYPDSIVRPVRLATPAELDIAQHTAPWPAGPTRLRVALSDNGSGFYEGTASPEVLDPDRLSALVAWIAPTALVSVLDGGPSPYVVFRGTAADTRVIAQLFYNELQTRLHWLRKPADAITQPVQVVTEHVDIAPGTVTVTVWPQGEPDEQAKRLADLDPVQSLFARLNAAAPTTAPPGIKEAHPADVVLFAPPAAEASLRLDLDQAALSTSSAVILLRMLDLVGGGDIDPSSQLAVHPTFLGVQFPGLEGHRTPTILHMAHLRAGMPPAEQMQAAADSAASLLAYEPHAVAVLWVDIPRSALRSSTRDLLGLIQWVRGRTIGVGVDQRNTMVVVNVNDVFTAREPMREAAAAHAAAEFHPRLRERLVLAEVLYRFGGVTHDLSGPAIMDFGFLDQMPGQMPAGVHAGRRKLLVPLRSAVAECREALRADVGDVVPGGPDPALALARQIVTALVRGLSSHGVLHLARVAPLLRAHPYRDRVWTVVFAFLALRDDLRPPIRFAELAETDPDTGMPRAVDLPAAALSYLPAAPIGDLVRDGRIIMPIADFDGVGFWKDSPLGRQPVDDLETPRPVDLGERPRPVVLNAVGDPSPLASPAMIAEWVSTRLAEGLPTWEAVLTGPAPAVDRAHAALVDSVSEELRVRGTPAARQTAESVVLVDRSTIAAGGAICVAMRLPPGPSVSAELAELERRALPGALTAAMGEGPPDLFDDRDPRPAPEFLHRLDVDKLPAHQVEPFLRAVDLTRGRPTAETVAMALADAHGPVALAPAPHTGALPMVVHVVRLGDPARFADLRDNLTDYRSRSATGFTPVLWTDLTRTAAERALAVPAAAVDRRGRDRDLLRWASSTGVVVVDIGEVFNAATPMFAHHLYAEELERGTPDAIATATALAVMEVLWRFGGLVVTGRGRIGDPSGWTQDAHMWANMGMFSRAQKDEFSALMLVQKHKFASDYLTELVERHRNFLQPGGLSYDFWTSGALEAALTRGNFWLAEQTDAYRPERGGAVKGMLPDPAPAPRRSHPLVAAGDVDGTVELAIRTVRALLWGLYRRGHLDMVLASRIAAGHARPEVVLGTAMAFLGRRPAIAARVDRVVIRATDPTSRQAHIASAHAVDSWLPPRQATGIAGGWYGRLVESRVLMPDPVPLPVPPAPQSGASPAEIAEAALRASFAWRVGDLDLLSVASIVAASADPAGTWTDLVTRLAADPEVRGRLCSITDRTVERPGPGAVRLPAAALALLAFPGLPPVRDGDQLRFPVSLALQREPNVAIPMTFPSVELMLAEQGPKGELVVADFTAPTWESDSDAVLGAVRALVSIALTRRAAGLPLPRVSVQGEARDAPIAAAVQAAMLAATTAELSAAGADIDPGDLLPGTFLVTESWLPLPYTGQATINVAISTVADEPVPQDLGDETMFDLQYDFGLRPRLRAVAEARDDLVYQDSDGDNVDASSSSSSFPLTPDPGDPIEDMFPGVLDLLDAAGGFAVEQGDGASIESFFLAGHREPSAGADEPDFSEGDPDNPLRRAAAIPPGHLAELQAALGERPTSRPEDGGDPGLALVHRYEVFLGGLLRDSEEGDGLSPLGRLVATATPPPDTGADIYESVVRLPVPAQEDLHALLSGRRDGEGGSVDRLIERYEFRLGVELVERSGGLSRQRHLTRAGKSVIALLSWADGSFNADHENAAPESSSLVAAHARAALIPAGHRTAIVELLRALQRDPNIDVAAHELGMDSMEVGNTLAAYGRFLGYPLWLPGASPRELTLGRALLAMHPSTPGPVLGLRARLALLPRSEQRELHTGLVGYRETGEESQAVQRFEVLLGRRLVERTGGVLPGHHLAPFGAHVESLLGDERGEFTGAGIGTEAVPAWTLLRSRETGADTNADHVSDDHDGSDEAASSIVDDGVHRDGVHRDGDFDGVDSGQDESLRDRTPVLEEQFVDPVQSTDTDNSARTGELGGHTETMLARYLVTRGGDLYLVGIAEALDGHADRDTVLATAVAAVLADPVLAKSIRSVTRHRLDPHTKTWSTVRWPAAVAPLPAAGPSVLIADYEIRTPVRDGGRAWAPTPSRLPVRTGRTHLFDADVGGQVDALARSVALLAVERALDGQAVPRVLIRGFGNGSRWNWLRLRGRSHSALITGEARAELVAKRFKSSLSAELIRLRHPDPRLPAEEILSVRIQSAGRFGVLPGVPGGPEARRGALIEIEFPEHDPNVW